MDREQWNDLKRRRKIEQKNMRVLRYWNSKKLGTARRDGFGWFMTEEEYEKENNR